MVTRPVQERKPKTHLACLRLGNAALGPVGVPRSPRMLGWCDKKFGALTGSALQGSYAFTLSNRL
jgi:hypothetical protein